MIPFFTEETKSTLDDLKIKNQSKTPFCSSDFSNTATEDGMVRAQMTLSFLRISSWEKNSWSEPQPLVALSQRPNPSKGGGEEDSKNCWLVLRTPKNHHHLHLFFLSLTPVLPMHHQIATKRRLLLPFSKIEPEKKERSSSGWTIIASAIRIFCTYGAHVPSGWWTIN